MISGIRTHLFIGAYEFVRHAGVRVMSARHLHLTLAEIDLADVNGALTKNLAVGEDVEIRWGYRDQTPAIWKGTVRAIKAGDTRDQIRVTAAGAELPMADTVICQSWADETPDAIIKWAVGQAGMPLGRIDSPGVSFPRFVASSIPVWQVARQCEYSCHKEFGIDMSRWAIWVGGDGKVYWGDFDEAGTPPVIETGGRLITNMPRTTMRSMRLNVATTFFMPDFGHSRLFHLIDKRRGMDGTYRALEVAHEVIDNTARTYIGYGEAVEKF